MITNGKVQAHCYIYKSNRYHTSKAGSVLSNYTQMFKNNTWIHLSRITNSKMKEKSVIAGSCWWILDFVDIKSMLTVAICFQLLPQNICLILQKENLKFYFKVQTDCSSLGEILPQYQLEKKIEPSHMSRMNVTNSKNIPIQYKIKNKLMREIISTKEMVNVSVKRCPKEISK